jgi:hypothetical protein
MRVNVYTNKMNNVDLAKALTYIVRKEYEFKIGDWRATAMDRDATTNASIHRLNNGDDNTRIAIISCISRIRFGAHGKEDHTHIGVNGAQDAQKNAATSDLQRTCLVQNNVWRRSRA